MKDYGAKADGVADDTAAINAAEVAAAAAGGTVLFPAGNYRLASSIQKLSNTYWVGATSTAGTTFGSVLKPAAGVTAVNVADNVYHWGIERMVINGGTTAIKTSGTTAHVRLVDVELSSQTGDAIQTDALEAFEFLHLTILAAGGHGWRGGLIVTGNGRTERGVITNLRVDNTALDGVFIDGPSGTPFSLLFNQPTIILAGRNGFHLTNAGACTINSLSMESASVSANNTYDGVLLDGTPRSVTFVSCNPGFSTLSPNAQRYGWNIAGFDHMFIGCDARSRTKDWFMSSARATLINCDGSATLQDWFTAGGFRTTVIGGTLAIDAQTSAVKPSPIASAPGADMVMFLDDSTQNGAGTVGRWQVRKSDANRTILVDVDPANGDVYSTGALRLNSALAGGAFRTGAGVPAAGLGNNGDYFFRSDGGAGTHIYFRSGGVWAAIV